MHHGDLGYTDQEVVDGVKKEGKKFRDRVFTEMQAEAEERLDQLLIADIETSREITEEDRSVVLRAFTSRGSDTPTSREHSAPTRRPRRAR